MVYVTINIKVNINILHIYDEHQLFNKAAKPLVDL